MHKAGFVNIVGNPNVGKSTLMNRLVGERISIITSKAQTTRHRILGIVNTDDMQIVFSDTPGVLKPKYKLQESMRGFSESALTDADILLYVTDVVEDASKNADFIEKVSKEKVPVLLVVNKIDLLKGNADLTAIIDRWKKMLPNAELFPMSAKENFNVDNLMARIKDLLPESPPYFGKDALTDKPARFFVTEIIREKAFRLLGDELPYGIAVTIDKWVEDDKRAEIIATLIVEREAHKGIVIGAQGEKLREISRLARADIAEMLGKNVYLEVWVRVRKGWNDDARALKSLGYE